MVAKMSSVVIRTGFYIDAPLTEISLRTTDTAAFSGAAKTDKILNTLNYEIHYFPPRPVRNMNVTDGARRNFYQFHEFRNSK